MVMTTPAKPRTGTAKRFGGSLPLALLLLGLCFAPTASAEFVSAPLPPGATSIRTLAVLDGSTWAAQVLPATGPQRVSVTSNRGVTWTDVAGLLSAGETIAGLAAAPGQTYRAVIALTGTPAKVQVKSITRGGTVTNLGAPFVRSSLSQGSIAVDDDGTTWVPQSFVPLQTRTWGVVQVTTSGQITDVTGPAGLNPSAVNAIRTPDGMRVWAAPSAGSFRVEGTSLVLEGPEPVLLRDGQLVFRPNTTSYDGGEHFLAKPLRGVVRGAPGQPPTTHLRFGARIATRFDARLFRAAPPILGAVVSTGTGFVASSATAILVNDGDLPPWPASIGAVLPDTTAMLARANGLRADAGLPPLIGDALLAKAARNHANYDKQWDEGHFETSGRAGFTGIEPGSRCAFVGTTCNQEVMYRGLSGSNAVDGWIATPFHRPALLGPRAGIVGPAQSDGAGQTTSVMESGENLQELVAEVGYPQGTYRGPLAFHGESPDPAGDCARIGQPVTYPLGAAVTLFAPGAALMTGVREVGGAALPGCVLVDVFLPEHPLVAGRTYEASGSWDLGGGARRTHTWTFTARPDGPPSGGGLTLPPFPLLPKTTPPRDSTRPRLTMTSMSPLRFRAAARGSSIVKRGSSRVAFTLSERARVRFEVERVLAGRRSGGRCLTPSRAARRAARCTRYVLMRGAFAYTAKSGRNTIRFSGRLRSRKLPAGRHRLRAVASDSARNASLPRRSSVFTIMR